MSIVQYQQEFIVASRLLFLVTRLAEIFKTYQSSLKTEFWPSDETKLYWTDELMRLSQTSWPIHVLLQEEEKIGKTSREFLTQVDGFVRVSLSEQVLAGSCNRWFDTAIYSLKQAIDHVEDWESSVKKEVDSLRQRRESRNYADGVVYSEMCKLYPAISFHPGRSELFGLRKKGFERLKNAKQAYGLHLQTPELRDRESCLASRELFLVAHLIRYFYPDMWTDQEQKQFLELHRDIEPNIRKNTAFLRSFVFRREDVEGALMDKFKGQFGAVDDAMILRPYSKKPKSQRSKAKTTGKNNGK